MTGKEPESRLVRHVLPDATDAEIREATEHWFGFLNTLYDIVVAREQKERDSYSASTDDNIKNPQNAV